MNVNSDKQQILRIFKYKTISDKKFNVTLKNIESFKDTDPLFYNLNMGKLHVLFGNSDDAIPYLEEVIKLDDSRSVAYYNLYKCYVKNGDFASAYINLYKCKCCESSSRNFEFPLSILCAITDCDIDFTKYKSFDYFVKPTNVEGYNQINNNELAVLHQKAILAFNNRDYINCSRLLKSMNVRIKEMQYPLETDTLVTLVDALQKKVMDNYYQLFLEDELEESEYADVVSILNDMGYLTDKEVLNTVKYTIEADFIRGKNLLEKVSVNPKFSKHKFIFKCLNGLVNYYEEFSKLDDETREEYYDLRNEAKRKYDRNFIDESIDLYMQLQEMTGLNIINYYLGKLYLRKGEYDTARELFLNYMEQGGPKMEKTLMFLANISKKVDKPKKYCEYIGKMKIINDMFDLNFKYTDFSDYDKKKLLKSVYMSLSDFESMEIPAVEDFYNVSLDDKLLIIRGLYTRGYNDLANKLLSETDRDSLFDEKIKVKQFERNKKIYMNQNRTTS